MYGDGQLREDDENRLVLYSQPIVPLADGRPGEELLLRMIGRDNEVILPGSFLPIAEKYGLIREIDRWVITQATRLAATGRRVIEANLSAASIGTSDLLPFIEQQIRETHADPADLVFEITETALMHDITAGEAFARGLTALGCGLALDDFGTGFGSFTYLKKLPITHLKIDIEFVRDLVTHPANLHVVKAIVSLARAFGLKTIAEGIEDEQTLELLRQLGVDYAQGFIFGRPGHRHQARTCDSSRARCAVRVWVMAPAVVLAVAAIVAFVAALKASAGRSALAADHRVLPVNLPVRSLIGTSLLKAGADTAG